MKIQRPITLEQKNRSIQELDYIFFHTILLGIEFLLNQLRILNKLPYNGYRLQMGDYVNGTSVNQIDDTLHHRIYKEFAPLVLRKVSMR